MGPGLLRKFVSFARQIDPSEIAAIKLHTNELERSFAPPSPGAPRRINLDPGYICGSKLVLATMKNHSHRIYLGQGVYVEITLEFRKGAFRPLEKTYRDYASEPYIRFFTKVRERYLEKQRSP